jgi:hypothetical protein
LKFPPEVGILQLFLQHVVLPLQESSPAGKIGSGKGLALPPLNSQWYRYMYKKKSKES